MKVCSKCRHINEDSAAFCEECNRSLAAIRPLEMGEKKVRRISKGASGIIILVVAAICITLLLVYAANADFSSGYNLPAWMQSRIVANKG